MNTTAAATQAGVTTATIRTWCRKGAVAAIKQSGRWVIEAASLAHRITIGAMHTRKQATVLDLTAATVKTRTRPSGETITRITNLPALLADQLNEIPDAGDRAHAATILERASIVISDTPDAGWDEEPNARHAGQLRTTYRGEVPQITVDDVLDLAEQIRTQLA
ncbi:hypothetical protein [Streptomyces sp. NBC_00847]|uniref:hypothetical protein n=1 Tax=Streptomyces sp. NBC_00847 TaxID=2975850 RepID=UPI00225E3E4B|nr:hypothetical protein [Streptomyces sp. NBC_00847]MCX4885920.1 helix-turn-helix domain-containing protein [Streptomyces sp. NBC_00847]